MSQLKATPQLITALKLSTLLDKKLVLKSILAGIAATTAIACQALPNVQGYNDDPVIDYSVIASINDFKQQLVLVANDIDLTDDVQNQMVLNQTQETVKVDDSKEPLNSHSTFNGLLHSDSNIEDEPQNNSLYDNLNETLDQPSKSQPDINIITYEDASLKTPQELMPNFLIINPKNHTISKAELLERARHNSSATITNQINPTSQTPAAYNQLMDKGVNLLKTNQINQAEAQFTRAQRLSPRTSAAYFYLGTIALKKNQLIKAEALARRGLSVATTTQTKRKLWKLILKSAQQRNNKNLMNEARLALR